MPADINKTEPVLLLLMRGDVTTCLPPDAFRHQQTSMGLLYVIVCIPGRLPIQSCIQVGG